MAFGWFLRGQDDEEEGGQRGKKLTGEERYGKFKTQYYEVRVYASPPSVVKSLWGGFDAGFRHSTEPFDRVVITLETMDGETYYMEWMRGDDGLTSVRVSTDVCPEVHVKAPKNGGFETIVMGTGEYIPEWRLSIGKSGNVLVVKAVQG